MTASLSPTGNLSQGPNGDKNSPQMIPASQRSRLSNVTRRERPGIPTNDTNHGTHPGTNKKIIKVRCQEAHEQDEYLSPARTHTSGYSFHTNTKDTIVFTHKHSNPQTSHTQRQCLSGHDSAAAIMHIHMRVYQTLNQHSIAFQFMQCRNHAEQKFCMITWDKEWLCWLTLIDAKCPL